MKKFLIATLLLTGLGAFVPEAKADHCDRYGGGYSSGYGDRGYYRHEAPVYRSYERRDPRCDERTYYRPPVRVYSDYVPRVHVYESRPRFSFFFGL